MDCVNKSKQDSTLSSEDVIVHIFIDLETRHCPLEVKLLSEENEWNHILLLI